MIALFLTILMACTDGHGTSNKGCHQAAFFVSPQMCAWVLAPLIKRGENFWDNGWQTWTIRCVEQDYFSNNAKP